MMPTCGPTPSRKAASTSQISPIVRASAWRSRKPGMMRKPELKALAPSASGSGLVFKAL